MTIPTKSWTQFVGDMVSSWGAGIGRTPVLSPGDFLLALFEAVAGQEDFLEAQIFQVLQLTRAATSTGPDLDTWMADFAFRRLPATFATGPVVASALTSPPAPVPVAAATLVGGVYQGGLLVTTFGGGIVYQAIPDTTQPSYQLASNTYILPAQATSISITVQAVAAGSASNVAAGTLTQLASQQAGISTVVNEVPIQNGVDAESDASFRSRFILYLATLARATKQAIEAAATSVQQGLQVALAENQVPNGTSQLGTFTVFVDNGTGSPPNSLLTSVFDAVDATRAFTVQPYVVAPNIQNITISLVVRLASGYTLGNVGPLIQSILADMVEELSAGAPLYVSAVETTTLEITGVVAIQPGQTLLNGANQDITPPTTTEVRVALDAITVNQY